MPHSGGRVGKGMYFASENSKSAAYGMSMKLRYVMSHCVTVRCAGSVGIMLLTEVALGKEHTITRDNSSLTKAPTGCDSVIARGHSEPGNLINFYIVFQFFTDPSKDTSITLDGKTVSVPQGKPIQQSQYCNSSFSQVILFSHDNYRDLPFLY